MLNPIREEYKLPQINNWKIWMHVWNKSWYEYRDISDEPVLDYLTKNWECKN